MEKEEGERKESFKYYHEGFYYHKKSKTNHSKVQEFRCVRFSYGCLGTAIQNELNEVKTKKEHNHPENFKAQAISNLKSAIIKGSAETDLKPKHFFNKTVNQYV